MNGDKKPLSALHLPILKEQFPDGSGPPRRMSSILRDIFEAEQPEQFTRSIPPEQLFLAIKENGLLSSSEVIEMASREQIQILLDLDLWSFDQFEEQQIWEWLELPDATEDLKVLQRVLHSIDPKLIAVLISKYLEVRIHEEPTDHPPEDGFYTPDKGRTWLRLNLKDSHQYFLFNRFLALIFETSAELFYQLIQVPTVATASVLEEDCYQEKTKRLVSEGFPDDEWAAEINSPIYLKNIVFEMDESSPLPSKPMSLDVFPIPAFLNGYSIPQPLKGLISELVSDEIAAQELTLLCNSAMIHYRIRTWELEEVVQIVDQVRGAINIGLEAIQESQPDKSALQIYRVTSFQKLYRVGLSFLHPIRKEAGKRARSERDSDPLMLTFLEGLQHRFPLLPQFLRNDGTFIVEEGNSERLKTGFRAFETLVDTRIALQILKRATSQ